MTHFALITSPLRMAPSWVRPETGVFHNRDTPHSCARSTILWCRTVRRTPMPVMAGKLASTTLGPSIKRTPRKTFPSPDPSATPNSLSAASVFGISPSPHALRSEEHTSELQSHHDLV